LIELAPDDLPELQSVNTSEEYQALWAEFASPINRTPTSTEEDLL
jgi:hypothetical protein